MLSGRLSRHFVLHYADLKGDEVEWKGAIKITRPLRTVVDCMVDAVEPDLVKQALEQGVRRGAFSRADVRRAVKERRA